MTLPYAVSHVANLVCPLTNERLEDPVVFYNCVHDNQGAMSRAAVLEKFKASEEEIPYICPFILCQHDARNNRPDVHTLPWLCNSCGQDKRRKVTCAVCHLVKSHPTDLVEAPALAHYLSSTPVSVLSVDVLEDDRYRVTGTEFPIYRAAPIGEPARKKYDFADEGKNKDRFISHTEEEEGPGFRVVPAQVIAKPILKRKRRSWEPETGDLAAAATSSGSAAAWGGDDASDLENRPWKSPKLSEAFVATTTTVQVTQVFRLVREGVPLSKQRPPEPPRTVVIRPDTKRHPGRRIGFRFTSEEAARHQVSVRALPLPTPKEGSAPYPTRKGERKQILNFFLLLLLRLGPRHGAGRGLAAGHGRSPQGLPHQDKEAREIRRLSERLYQGLCLLREERGW